MTKPTCIYMNKYTLLSETVKSSVTMRQIVERYTAEPIQKDRIPCPFHNGKNANLWFSDTGYHCFVCGAGGDSISFVQHLFGLSFSDALRKIAEDFCLPLPIDRKAKLTELRAMQRVQSQAAMERKAAQQREQEWAAEYQSRVDEWIRLDKNRRRYAPKSAEEEPHPLFIEAIKNLDRAAYRIDSFPPLQKS